MSKAATLAFYRQSQYQSYADAKESNGVYFISLDFGETHKGLRQSAVWDAMEIIHAVRDCYGVKDDPLTFAMLDGETVIDFN